MSTPFAFYGTLMQRDERGVILSGFEHLGSYGTDCKIPGLLYNVGAFPGLVEGDGVAHGQLWYPSYGWAEEALHCFDRIESYHSDDESRSMYLRRVVRLIEPEGVDAYVYFWNYDLRGCTLIESGRWPGWADDYAYDYNL